MKIFNIELMNRRRQIVKINLNEFLGNEDVVLIFSGEPIQKPGGLDQNYFYLPHPEYFWLTGSRRSSGILTYSKRFGWIDFVADLTDEERIWEGATAEAEFELNEGSEEAATVQASSRNKYENAELQSVRGFNAWLELNQFKNTFALGQAPLIYSDKNTRLDSVSLNFLQEQLNKSRRPKDLAEIDLIKKAAQCAAAGYSRLSEFIQPGISERQVQLEYESAVLRAGAEKFPYDTIVGSGIRSAVLHALPTSKIISAGDLILIDGGADIHDYCVDITRVFSADKKWSLQQKTIFDIVLEAQTKSILLCRTGVEWHDVHRASARIIAEGLKSLNILKGSVDSLLDGAISLFLPHGVGHMVGHRVRDVGRDVTKVSAKCCGVNVRVDFKLEENFLMTVEPGLYFIDPLLNLKANRERYKNEVNWSELEKWKSFGGIRLEDDILVTSAAPENLTGFIPKL